MLSPLLLLCAGDFAIAYAAFSVGALMRYGFDFQKLLTVNEECGIFALTMAAMLIFVSYLSALYQRGEIFLKWKMLFRSIGIASICFIILSQINLFLHIQCIDTYHLLFSLILFVPFQFTWHSRCHLVFEIAGLRSWSIVLGDGALSEQVAELMLNDQRGEVFLGFVRTSKEAAESRLGKNLGHIADIEKIVEENKANRIVIALSERRGTLPVRELLTCKLKGTQIIDAVSYVEEATGKLMLEYINPSWFIFSEGSRITPSVRIIRRTADMVFATIGILLALPIMPFIALAVRLDSPGPVFFKQLRVGESDRNFWIYKFRTMRQDAETKTGAVWAVVSDPRITKVGKFLRKSRLDEIPQLFNVFMGNMSFVGPRPERPEFVKMLEQEVPYYGNRHCIKPGVTGWAQVRYHYGASVEDALAKLRYDLFYIKNYTITMDIIILIETVRVVLFGRGSR